MARRFDAAAIHRPRPGNLTETQLRYVVLKHRLPTPRSAAESDSLDQRGDHFDWMFETEAGLLTWATERMPAIDRETLIDALSLPLHRHAYLDYEGPISRDRGTVSRVESGVYVARAKLPDRLEVDFLGHRSGCGTFYRTCDGDSSSWRFGFLPANTRLSRVDTS